jgi:hypothetical protein
MRSEVAMKSIINWYETLYSLAEISDVLEERTASVFRA